MKRSALSAGLLITVVGAFYAPSAFAWNFNHPTYSSPIVISADNKLVWSVNPADNSVSVVRTDTNTLIRNIKVGKEPQSVAVDPENKFAYVANAAGSNVAVIKIINSDPAAFQADVVRHLTTGAEPWNIVSSPDGKRIFVANSSQDTITVIDAKQNIVIGNVDLRDSLCNDPDRSRHFQPRGLAVTRMAPRCSFPREVISISHRARRFLRWITVSLKLDGRRVRVAISRVSLTVSCGISIPDHANPCR